MNVAISQYDGHGNPIYAQNWTLAITDPYFAAVEAAAVQNTTWLPTPPPFPWANEVINRWNTSNQSSSLYNVPALVGNGFTSDWSMPVGTPELGYYV